MTNELARQLIAGLRRPVRPGMVKLRDFVQRRPSARKWLAEVRSAESLVAGGFDPLHAAYASAQSYLSVFGELAARLRELDAYRLVAGRAQETYMPGWPPISPVSESYFAGWALLDLPIGPSGETICSCALEIGRALGLPADLLHRLELMGASAMGLYRHLGWRDGRLGLRDIVDGRDYSCIVPSGYRGEEGELWYVRLLPPLNETFDHGVAFTSPYVLGGATEADWLACLERLEPPPGAQEAGAARARTLLKRGPDANYWNEFVFLAYHHAVDGAIMLTGLPDRPATLPHAKPGGW